AGSTPTYRPPQGPPRLFPAIAVPPWHCPVARQRHVSRLSSRPGLAGGRRRRGRAGTPPRSYVLGRPPASGASIRARPSHRWPRNGIPIDIGLSFQAPIAPHYEEEEAQGAGYYRLVKADASTFFRSTIFIRQLCLWHGDTAFSVSDDVRKITSAIPVSLAVCHNASFGLPRLWLRCVATVIPA
ncbi:hypothetical protein NGA_2089620, partial [Nannochloropsis gaditana CCMP526]|uniref:uncharacterized protein n=1 Tax=Nannochloropsis gaditana (strain CCMP526) TaxID=1093141 RepID=UPI00029F5F34